MRVALLIISVLVSGFGFTQTGIRFSQLNFAQGINNPAAIAFDGQIMVDMIGRSQWMGFDGAPNTFALNGQYEIEGDMAVGLNVFHDRIGVNQTTAVSGQYAYRLFTQTGRVIAMGVGLGIDNHIIDYGSSTTTIPDDPAFMNSYSRVLFQASVGGYYYAPRFYAGVSLPEIFQPRFESSGKARPRPLLQYYFNAGWFISGGENYTFNPNIQVKAVENAPLAGDLILRNTFMGRFSVVVGYRTEHSVIAGIDMLITPMLRAGYSFNHDVGKLARAKGMSNELYIGMAFPYRNSRNDFDRRRYVSTKGGFKRTYRKHQNRNGRTRHNR
jgi:type IX secretion system PorP/SprF family membrane protein